MRSINTATYSVALSLIAVAALVLALPSARSVLLSRLPPAWRIAISAWRHDIAVDHSVAMRMPDGVELRASLYLPRGAGGPLPTVLMQLPYHRLSYGEGPWPLFFAMNGYAAVVQDLRGTGDSGGELLPWRDAAEDGVTTLEWITRQTWSNGKVGTFGCSALGEVQFVLAKKRHPAHRAMIPSGAGGAVGTVAGRYSYFGAFEGGIFQLASGFGWFVSNGTKDPKAAPARAFDLATHLAGLPVSGLVRSVRPAPNGYSEYLATPMGDPKWNEWGFLTDDDRVNVPSLVINSWGDQTVGDTLALAESWRKSDPESARQSTVVIAPALHCAHDRVVAKVDRFGDLLVKDGSRPYREWYLQWFNRWLKGEGEGLTELKAFNFFMLGEDRWLASESWPPGDARPERWYLASGGHANSSRGDGTLASKPGSGTASDSFPYDPMNPVPSRGGPVCCTGERNEQAGPRDQADVESRDDVLVYTSAPLERDIRIAGPLKSHLTVSSSAPDTDLVARLVHVQPDGKATGIQEGALRLRYRDGFASPVLLDPGRRYEVVVDMRSIAYTIPKGHRLRLHVTSSSFPRLERNLNNGAPNNSDESAGIVAVNTIYHDAHTKSFVEFPALPGE